MDVCEGGCVGGECVVICQWSVLHVVCASVWNIGIRLTRMPPLALLPFSPRSLLLPSLPPFLSSPVLLSLGGIDQYEQRCVLERLGRGGDGVGEGCRPLLLPV